MANEARHPKTELEYFEAIEGLGGLQWRMNHDLADGRIEDPKGEVSESIDKLQASLEQLVDEVCGNFCVIHPKDCPKLAFGETSPPASQGKTYYWDWYKKMEAESYAKEYNGIICSACPFSGGVEEMIRLRQIPCNEFNGSLYNLHNPFTCGMLSYCEWTEEYLYSRISEFGAEALEKFKAKEKELKAAAGVGATKPEVLPHYEEM